MDLDRFSAYQGQKYKQTSIISNEAPQDLDDSMDVDDDSGPDIMSRPDARNSLHIQVVEHFTALLVELVGRTGGADLLRQLENKGVATSIYAPQWQKKGKHYNEWSAPDCVEYLDDKKKRRSTSPRLEVFLSKPYSYQGARRGQDWSPMDWKIALGALKRLGDDWNEPSLQESLVWLEPHLEIIFAQKMEISG